MATKPSTLRRDPSRTTPIRAAFVRDINARFARIRRAVVRFLVTDDELGLDRAKAGPPKLGLQANVERYAFETDDKKLDAFNAWFKAQVEAGLLEVVTEGLTSEQVARVAIEPWTATYVRSSYKQAVVRAFTEVRKEALSETAEFFDGSKAEFLREAFDSPESIAKVRMVATRSYENLKGVTGDMSARTSRVMSEAISNGWGARKTADKLNKEVTEYGRKRAERIARTEIIHAHSEGQLDAYERLDIKELDVQAEWLTAVGACPKCVAAAAGGPYTIEQARGMIPLHPHCRCAWAPKLDVFKAADGPDKPLQKPTPKSRAPRKPKLTQQPKVDTPPKVDFAKPDLQKPVLPKVVPETKPEDETWRDRMARIAQRERERLNQPPTLTPKVDPWKAYRERKQVRQPLKPKAPPKPKVPRKTRAQLKSEQLKKQLDDERIARIAAETRAKAAEQQATKAVGSVAVIHSDTTSLKFRKQIDDAVASIPAPAMKKIAAYGATVQAPTFLTDALPQLKGVRPPGHSVGSTWDSIEGLYSPSKKTVVVSEKYLKKQTTYVKGKAGKVAKEVYSDRIAGTVRHELGHAFDYADGQISDSPEFKKVFAADRSKWSSTKDAVRTKRMQYYHQDGALGGRKECVAEAFGILTGGGCAKWTEKEFKEAFPGVLEFMKGRIEA